MHPLICPTDTAVAIGQSGCERREHTVQVQAYWASFAVQSCKSRSWLQTAGG